MITILVLLLANLAFLKIACAQLLLISQTCLHLVNILELQRMHSLTHPLLSTPPNHLLSYGESHCRSVGCIVDGCPPGMALTEADIQPQMTRRRPGQSALTTPRDEKDRVEIQSGTEFGVTLGTPIAMIVRNEDQRPKDYGGSTMDMYPRPSHADFTYLEKYGVKASSGGGRSSARETIGIRACSDEIPLNLTLTA